MKKSFECVVCDTSFVKKPSLKRHIVSVHEGNNPCNKCDICETTFADKYRLKMHVTSFHERIKSS